MQSGSGPRRQRLFDSCACHLEARGRWSLPGLHRGAGGLLPPASSMNLWSSSVAMKLGPVIPPTQLP